MGAVAEKIPFPKSRPAGPGKGVIQPALKVGKPNDKFENEAESVADQVMMMPSTPATPLMMASPGKFQMQPSEENEIQMSPLPAANSRLSFREQVKDDSLDSNQKILSEDTPIQSGKEPDQKTAILQPKLTVSKAGDKYEKEADWMADKVVQRSAAPDVQEKCETCKSKKIHQSKPLADRITPFVQRKAIPEEENISFKEEGFEPDLTNQAQRKEVDEEEEMSIQAKSHLERSISPATWSSVESTLNAGNGLGYGLSDGIRKEMEAGYGVDLSKAKIHTDETAVRMNELLGAQAFAYGWDVFFNRNKYRPNTYEGKLLLAHELAHTLQQARSKGELLKPAETRLEQEMPRIVDEKLALVEMQQKTEAKADKIQEEKAKEAISKKEGVKSEDKNEISNPTKRKEPTLPACKPTKTNAPAAPGTAQSNLPTTSPVSTGQAEPQPENSVVEEAPKCPSEDPAFRVAKSQVAKDAKKQRDHELPDKKRDETMTASALPTQEQSQQSGQEQQTANLETAAQPKSFDRFEFKRKLKEKIESKMPNSEEEAKKFAGSGKLDEAKQEFQETISTEKGKVTGTLETVQQQDLPQGQNLKPDNKEIPEAKPADAPSKIPTGQAAPKPRTDQEISLDHKSKELDQQMVQEGINEKQLEESEEPQFEKALQTKRDAQREIAAAPDRFRQIEEQRLQKSQNRADQISGHGLNEMSAIKTTKTEEVFGGQKTKETTVEKRQREIKESIDGIYIQTEKDVHQILEELSITVETSFSEAVENANETFKARVRSRLDDHYGWFTFDDKIAEWAGLSDGVAHIFREEKERFLTAMDTVLENIAGTVEKELNRALERIKQGRTQLEGLKATLSEEELEFAGEMFTEALTKFTDLESSVNESQDELIESLSDAYVESVNKLQEEFDKINEELSASWIADAFSFIGDVASAIKKLGQLLSSIASRIGEYLSDILDSPKRFFNNLVAGIKGGMDEFATNIDTYLEQGFWMWLTGASSAVKIQIPKKMDAEGMFNLATQLLGITKEFILERIKLKLRISIDQFLALADKAESVGGKILEPVKILINEGIGALWEWVKTEVTNHLESIFKKIKEEIFQAIIKKFLLWVAQLFIPGLGFIKLIQAAYKALKWLVDNIDRIAEIVNSFLDAIGLAVKGNVSAIKENVIKALTNGVVIAIDFLAKLVGLGNFADKLQRGIEMIRKPIYKVIDLILIKARPIVKKVQKAIAKIQGKVKGKVEAGKEKLGKAKEKVLGWLGLRKKFTLPNGEKHEAYFKNARPQAPLIISSTDPKTIQQIISAKSWNNKKIPDDKLTLLQASSSKIDANREGQGIEKGKIIKAEFDKIVAILNAIGGPAIPKTTVVRQEKVTGAGMEMGKHLIVSPLSLDPGGLVGSEPTYTTGLGALLKLNYPNYIVEGHLLNHKLHGPGNVSWNLTPIAKQTNSEMNSKFERFAKKHILGEGKVVKYEVEVEYGKNLDAGIYSDPDAYVAENLNFSLTELEHKGNDWKPAATQPKDWNIPASIPHAKTSIPGFGTGKLNFMVNLNTSDVRAIQRVKGVGPTRAQAIVKYREDKKKNEGTQISSYSELEAAPGIGNVTVELLRAEPMVRIRS